MSETLYLWGAARSVPKRDCIGFPVFSAGQNEVAHFCETDDQLRIIRFTPLSDTGWDIEVFGALGAPYRVGSYVPVPYWVDGKLKIITADTPVRTFQPSASPVVRRIERTLRIAQKSDNENEERRRAKQFIADHSDLLGEHGYSPKEWVLHFRKALEQAGQLSLVDRHVEDFLDEASIAWALARTPTSSWRTCELFVSTVQEIGSPRLQRSPSVAFALLNVLMRVRSVTPPIKESILRYRQDSTEESIIKPILDAFYPEKRAIRLCVNYLRQFRSFILRSDGTRALTLSEGVNGFTAFGNLGAFAHEALEFKRGEVAAYLDFLRDRPYLHGERNEVADAAAHRLYNDIKLVAALLNVLEGAGAEMERAASFLRIPPAELHRLRQASKRVLRRQQDFDGEVL